MTALVGTAAAVEILKDGPAVITQVAEGVAGTVKDVKDKLLPTAQGEHAAGPDSSK